MAKDNRTTSPARRASVATATICQLEDEAHAEAFGLQHLAALMMLMGENVGTPGAGLTDMATQELGLRIEYLASLIKRHADVISAALVDIRTTAEQAAR